MYGKMTAKLLREVLDGWGRGVDRSEDSSQGRFNEQALALSVPRLGEWIAELEKEEKEKARQASSRPA